MCLLSARPSRCRPKLNSGDACEEGEDEGEAEEGEEGTAWERPEEVEDGVLGSVVALLSVPEEAGLLSVAAAGLSEAERGLSPGDVEAEEDGEGRTARKDREGEESTPSVAVIVPPAVEGEEEAAVAGPGAEEEEEEEE